MLEERHDALSTSLAMSALRQHRQVARGLSDATRKARPAIIQNASSKSRGVVPLGRPSRRPRRPKLGYRAARLLPAVDTFHCMVRRAPSLTLCDPGGLSVAIADFYANSLHLRRKSKSFEPENSHS